MINTNASYKFLEEAVEEPKNTVRSHLLFYYQKGTPQDDGSILYEIIQQIDMGGLLPNSLAFDGVLNGLVTEINGFFGYFRRNYVLHKEQPATATEIVVST